MIRQLCNRPVQINDVYSYDQQLYQSWNTILNGKAEEISSMGLNFCAYHDVAGEMRISELCANGASISVSQANKKEYVEKMYPSPNLGSPSTV